MIWKDLEPKTGTKPRYIFKIDKNAEFFLPKFSSSPTSFSSDSPTNPNKFKNFP